MFLGVLFLFEIHTKEDGTGKEVRAGEGACIYNTTNQPGRDHALTNPAGTMQLQPGRDYASKNPAGTMQTSKLYVHIKTPIGSDAPIGGDPPVTQNPNSFFMYVCI